MRPHDPDFLSVFKSRGRQSEGLRSHKTCLISQE